MSPEKSSRARRDSEETKKLSLPVRVPWEMTDSRLGGWEESVESRPRYGKLLEYEPPSGGDCSVAICCLQFFTAFSLPFCTQVVTPRLLERPGPQELTLGGLEYSSTLFSKLRHGASDCRTSSPGHLLSMMGTEASKEGKSWKPLSPTFSIPKLSRQIGLFPQHRTTCVPRWVAQQLMHGFLDRGTSLSPPPPLNRTDRCQETDDSVTFARSCDC